MRTGHVLKTFVVPAGAGALAPEVIYFKQEQVVDGGEWDRLRFLRVLVGTLVATAVIEIDLLKPGRKGDVDADYHLLAISYNTAGLKALEELALWKGGRIRVRSGGTAGNQDVTAAWCD